jgi:hypothetical protein
MHLKKEMKLKQKRPKGRFFYHAIPNPYEYSRESDVANCRKYVVSPNSPYNAQDLNVIQVDVAERLSTTCRVAAIIGTNS